MSIFLITGGVRSGKSTFAEEMVKNSGNKVVYIATAQCIDKEMEERIALHRARRPSDWEVKEVPYNLHETIKNIAKDKIILIDCLTIYLTNHLLALAPNPEDVNDWSIIQKQLMEVVEKLIDTLKESNSIIVIVSNEIGLGLVPPYPLGRVFRDIAGLANQQIAKISSKVIFVAAGIPIDLKQFKIKEDFFKKERNKE